MLRLPIDSHLPQILRAVEQASVTLLRATPGAGKTTRVPAALLRSGRSHSRVLVLEPRRVAAKFAAVRVAEELGTSVGERVGYHFRFERKFKEQSELVFLTEGMFLRWLAQDPRLAGVGLVVLDEFHERSLSGDVALAALRALQKGERPDLKLLIMSATLETEALQAYLAAQGLEAPVIDVEAARYPLEVRFRPEPVRDRGLEAAVEEACRAVCAELPRGDLLVFLPGRGEIRRCEERLARWAEQEGLWVLPLHGELSREEQDRAILPQKRRKIVLSTNIAETSLTLDGLSAVIDSGWARQASIHPGTGIPRLLLQRISKASATQRAGRAARQGPGLCLRLYTAGEYEGFRPYELPEILRADLAQPFLELQASRLGSPRALPWLTPPSDASAELAESLLLALGAVDSTGALTERGAHLARAPTHPRIARLLEEARRGGVEEQALDLAVGLLEGRSFPSDPIEAVLRGRGELPQGFTERRLREQLRNWLSSGGAPPEGQPRGESLEIRLARALLAGFPDRVAKRRPGSKPDAPWTELFLAAGGTAQAATTAALWASDPLVALEILEKKRPGQARTDRVVSAFAPIQEEWLLEMPWFSEERTLDTQAGRLEEVTRWQYGRLTLLEERRRVEKGASGAQESEALWVEEVLKRGWSAVAEEGAVEAFRERMKVLARWGARGLESSEIAAVDEAWLKNALTEFAQGKTSLRELSEGGFLDFLKYRLEPRVLAALEREAPEHFTLPQGRRLRIHYSPEKPAWVESRLQDFFGLRETPSIASGRQKLTLHLLAPSGRPVQVTSDLPGFWKGSYAEVKKELFRRYPRHPWPDDPAAASPPAPRGRRE